MAGRRTCSTGWRPPTCCRRTSWRSPPAAATRAPRRAPTPSSVSTPPTTTRTSSGLTASSSAGRRRPPSPRQESRQAVAVPGSCPNKTHSDSSSLPNGGLETETPNLFFRVLRMMPPQRLARPLLLALLLALLLPPLPARAGSPALSEAAGWLQQYLRIDTSNPPGNEGKAAAFLAGILQRAGIPSRVVATPDGRGDL